MNDKIAMIIVSLLLALIMWPLISFVMAIVVMIAWNFTMPAIFALPEIKFWQAFWLTLLVNLLIKSNVSVSK